MVICQHCFDAIDEIDSHCTSCKEKHVYHIGHHDYSYQEVCAKIDSNEWTGFTVVTKKDGSLTPLNRHRNFITFFLQASKSPSEGVPIMTSNSLRTKEITPAQIPITPSKSRDVSHKKPNVRLLFMFILLFAVIFASRKAPNMLGTKTMYPPSKLVDYIHLSREDILGQRGFPREGDLARLAQRLQQPDTNWNGDDLGELFLSATLSSELLPTDFPLWLSWAHNVYPQSESIVASKASWSFRYALFSEGCALAEKCVHEACDAMYAVCHRREESMDSGPYLARYSLVYRLGHKYPLKPSLFQHVPVAISLSLEGDLALSKGDYSQGLRLYKKAQKKGADVTEELILTYAMMRDFTSIQKILFTIGDNVQGLSFRTQHIIIRTFIEKRQLEKAKRLLEKLPDSATKEIQTHHIASLMNEKLDVSLSCHPVDSNERFYCARVLVIKGLYDKAKSMVADLPLGDPIRSVTELLIAMRKRDFIAMDDAIKSFAYGPSQLLSLEHPHTAFVPSFSLEEMERVLRSNISSVESRAIMDWVFLQNADRILEVDVVSAPICSAILLYSLEKNKYKRAEEKLKCLRFFDMNDSVMDFYHRFIRAQLHPDLYAKTYWRESLGDLSPRGMWYWSWLQERSIESFNRIHMTQSTFLSFGSRWYENQDGYVE